MKKGKACSVLCNMERNGHYDESAVAKMAATPVQIEKTRTISEQVMPVLYMSASRSAAVEYAASSFSSVQSPSQYTRRLDRSHVIYSVLYLSLAEGVM